MQATSNKQKYSISPLVSDQSWLLAIIAGSAFVFAMVTVFVVNFFTEIEISAWEVVGTIAPWYMATIGGWIMYTMAPLFVAHGRTRSFAFLQWLTTGLWMTVIGAVSMAVGFVLEKWIYNIANFTGTPASENIFDSPYDVHLILLQYLSVFAVWFALGGFVGISLYSSDDAGWLSIPVALILAGVSGTWAYGGVGLFGVVRRIVPSFDFDTTWIEAALAITVLAFGILAARKILITISLRNP